MTDWQTLESHCKINCPEGGWKPDAIRTHLDAILAKASIPIGRQPIGESFEGRPLELLTLGTGSRRVLLWTQMHGNEPTHTTALLNLLRELSQEGSALVEGLCENLTLGLILPLNPDGAERNTRHNAQGIDINRDALCFATSEGRALRTAIESFKPEFGFNLHNQRHRLSIGSPPEPVAVSLLVPPIDEPNTQTESTRLANLVAATFCERVRSHCDGRISRYGIDYMARAFGEWVQRQGVATILIEAGGWPDGRFEQVDVLHYAALVQTLETIATDRLKESDPNSYLDLPRFHDHLLFDKLVTKTRIAQSSRGETTFAEIGIDFPTRAAGTPSSFGGVIRAIGDLHENGAIETLDAADTVVLPGRILLADTEETARAAALGATTLLVSIGATKVDADQPIPLNIALVALASQLPHKPASLLAYLATALVEGLVAVIDDTKSGVVREVCHQLAVPLLPSASVPTTRDPLPALLGEWVAETRTLSNQLGWSDRGQIGLHAAADFALVRAAGTTDRVDSLHAICVGGTVTHLEGKVVCSDAGRYLA